MLNTFDEIDKYLITSNNEEKKDKMFRRFFLTWNNPFWENQFDEIDINNTNLVLNLEKYDLYYYKKESVIDLFDFKYIKYFNNKTNQDEVVERPFFKNVDAIKSYFVNLTNWKYYAFQIEKGGNSELTHIQALLNFSKPINFSTFCRWFPLADFSDVYSSNTKAKAYVTKEETRIDGPWVDGDFAEERSRTDIKEFLSLINIGAEDEELEQLYPNLYLREFNKLDALKLRKQFNKYKKISRQVNVTYLYGPPGCGKSTYIDNRVGFENSFRVDTYDNSAFTNYAGESVLVLDEFVGHGQFKVTTLNKFLDTRPVQLRGLGCVKYACWNEVYIISNLHPKDTFKDLRDDEQILKKAFLRRLHNVWRMDNKRKIIVEKGKGEIEQISMELITDTEEIEKIQDIF